MANTDKRIKRRVRPEEMVLGLRMKRNDGRSTVYTVIEDRGDSVIMKGDGPKCSERVMQKVISSFYIHA